MTPRSPIASLNPRQGGFIQPGLSIIAVLALLVGVITGLLALAAPVGVWLDLWDFRQGFSILRKVNSWGFWIMVGVVAVAILVVVGALWSKPPKAKALIIMVGVGALASVLAYYVPESYRPAAEQAPPPIHDISTDTVNPPQFSAVLALRADAPNSTEYGSGPNMTPEKLAQLQQSAYPDIQPRHYRASKEAVFKASLAAANELGWELVSQDYDAGRIEATDTTFWFRFKDDVVIVLEEQGEQILVNARSVSRVGVGDVGTNAKRLRNFFALLDKSL